MNLSTRMKQYESVGEDQLVPNFPGMMEINYLVKMRFGSHVYGTSLPTSDTDIKGVYVPNAREILLQQVKGTLHSATKEDANARNTAQDVDTEVFSLQQYLRLLCEGQTVALDMLFTPREFYLNVPASAWHFDILGNRERFLHRGTSAFIGYCLKQAAKYGIKGSRMGAVRGILNLLALFPEQDRLEDHEATLQEACAVQEFSAIVDGPTERFLEVCQRKVGLKCSVKHAKAVFQKVFDKYGERSLQAEMNEGIDWKALMHAVRVLGQAKELLLTGYITFPRPDADFLLKIRKGELSYREVAEMIEAGVQELAVIRDRSILPERPDTDFVDDLVMRVYSEVINP